MAARFAKYFADGRYNWRNGYRNNDDGNCGLVVSGLRSAAANARMGAYAKRRAAIYTNCAVANDLSRRGNFYRRGDIQFVGRFITRRA